jgi:hypothetical protein
VTEWLQAEVVVFQLLFYKEIDGAEIGDNLGVIKAPVDKEVDGKHYSESRRRILTILGWFTKYMGE